MLLKKGRKMKKRIMLVMLFIMLLAAPMSCFALGGTVSYPDGSPASEAQVIVTGGGEGKTVVTCDESGRFEMDSLPDGHAVMRVRAAGKGYAQVQLPSSLFKSGDVVVVLPAKQRGE